MFERAVLPRMLPGSGGGGRNKPGNRQVHASGRSYVYTMNPGVARSVNLAPRLSGLQGQPACGKAHLVLAQNQQNGVNWVSAPKPSRAEYYGIFGTTFNLND